MAARLAGVTHKRLTLLLVLDNVGATASGACTGRVLLGLKKRGFGQGKLNGFGGKVEAGETVAEAAARELEEEAGIKATDAVKCGMLHFEFEDDPTWLEVHVFRATQYTGNPSESDEMRPEWFEAAQIPFEKMWLDDKYWFPLLLKGSDFSGYFLFRGHDSILQYALTETILPLEELLALAPTTPSSQ
eukprot:m.80326 g.80326  ORF g.80326 m.80326 type:complete len:188 (+) comp14659_c1_seq1:1046-1609(+)